VGSEWGAPPGGMAGRCSTMILAGTAQGLQVQDWSGSIELAASLPLLPLDHCTRHGIASHSPCTASRSCTPRNDSWSEPPPGMPGPAALLVSRMSEAPGVSRVTLVWNTSCRWCWGIVEEVSAAAGAAAAAAAAADGDWQQEQQAVVEVSLYRLRHWVMQPHLLALDGRIERQCGSQAPPGNGLLQAGA